MLSNLPASLLLALGAILCLITLYIVYKVSVFLNDFLDHLKKANLIFAAYLVLVMAIHSPAIE